MRALLILNPSAGGGVLAQRLRELEDDAVALGHHLDVIIADNADVVRRAAHQGLETGRDRILAAGGDGTMNLVASVLAGTGRPLGVIPLGTANMLAREIGVPLDSRKALQLALEGSPRCIDLGMANGRYFILTAGLGLDARVISEITPRFKELLGPLAYVTLGLQEVVRYRPSTFHVTVDSHTLDFTAWLMVVGNAGYYAYDIAMAPDARMDDGLLDVSIFTEYSAMDRLSELSAVLIGQHIHHPHVLMLRTREIEIIAEPPVQLQLDGDPAGVTPAQIAVCPGSLSVITPGDTCGCPTS